VKIRINEGEVFRPGMSVTAEVETRYRTNVLTVPIQSITTRIPKPPGGKDKTKQGEKPTVVASAPTGTATDAATAGGTNSVGAAKKANEPPKPVEVVFLVDAGKAKMVRVKAGISDDSYCEILEGLSDGQEVISGGYKAISRELEDGKRVKVGPAKSEANKDKK
jgi:HlyD family secretion protein